MTDTLEFRSKPIVLLILLNTDLPNSAGQSLTSNLILYLNAMSCRKMDNVIIEQKARVISF